MCSNKTKDTVHLLKESTNKADLRFFLGFRNVHERLVPSVTTKLSHIHLLLGKDSVTKFSLDEREQSTVYELKGNVISLPMFCSP